MNEFEFNNTEKDELVVVQLPRKDVMIMRKMIQEREAMGFLKNKIYVFITVFLSGILTLLTFGDTIKKGLMSWLGS